MKRKLLEFFGCGERPEKRHKKDDDKVAKKPDLMQFVSTDELVHRIWDNKNLMTQIGGFLDTNDQWSYLVTNRTNAFTGRWWKNPRYPRIECILLWDLHVEDSRAAPNNTFFCYGHHTLTIANKTYCARDLQRCEIENAERKVSFYTGNPGQGRRESFLRYIWTDDKRTVFEQFVVKLYNFFQYKPPSMMVQDDVVVVMKYFFRRRAPTSAIMKVLAPVFERIHSN
jgi:hypothetical protein